MKVQRKRWAIAFLLLASLAFSFVQSATAGTSGKITGRIMDVVKKEPLPGVTVVLEGMRRGAVTQADGYYYILSVDPGVYKLTASLVGYNKVSKQDVRAVADYTTTVNFDLKETAVQMSEMVVMAERPPVEPDKTDSKYVVTKENIEALPMARSLADLMALQPGVYQNDATIIRGGDSQDAAFYVDGVRIVTTDFNGPTSQSPSIGPRTFTGINKTSIQELVVVSGGANAEYGNLESGVISVVTRDGSKEFHGWGDLAYTPPGQKHWGANAYDSAFHKGKVKWTNRGWSSETVTLGPGADGKVGTADDQIALAHRRFPYTNEKGYLMEGGLAGPLTKRSTFLFTGRWSRKAYRFPGASLVTPLKFSGNLKLAFEVSQNVRLKIGQIYGYQEYWGTDRTNPLTGTAVPSAYRDLAANGTNLFLPDGSGGGKSKIIDNMTYLTLTHTLSPKAFYEIKVSRYRTTEDTINVPAAGYKLGFPLSSFPTKDLDGWFNVKPATAIDYVLSKRNRWEVKADFSNQITRGHFLKAGSETIFYDMTYYRYYSPNPGRRDVIYVTQPGNLPNVQEPVKPFQMAFYLQDKMEFEGLILNAGVRYDAFFTNTKVYNSSILQSPQWRWLIFHKDMPTYNPRHTSVFSPRLGVSHPITARSQFHFTAGLYTRLPDLIDMFSEQWQASAPDDYVPYDGFRGTRSQQSMMNAYVQYMRTRAFEAGTDWNFVADYTAGVTTYYKSAIGKIANGSRYWWDPQGPLGSIYVWGRKPNQQQDLKGVEMSLRKKLSHMFSFNAALNFGWATSANVGSNATMFWPDSNYVSDDNRFYDFQWNATTKQYEKKFFTDAQKRSLGNIINNHYLSYKRGQYDIAEFIAFDVIDAQKVYGAPAGIVGMWQHAYGGSTKLVNAKGQDRRTSANVSLYFQSPPDFGPAVRSFNPIGDMRANMIYRVQSGAPVVYTPPGLQQELRHKPIVASVDLQMEKTLVGKGSQNMIFYVEVFNLFNQRDSEIPFNYPDYVEWGLNLPRPDDATFQQYGDYNELSRYEPPANQPDARTPAPPRQINMGIRLNF